LLKSSFILLLLSLNIGNDIPHLAFPPKAVVINKIKSLPYVCGIDNIPARALTFRLHQAGDVDQINRRLFLNRNRGTALHSVSRHSDTLSS
jgi:hypothetical protein